MLRERAFCGWIVRTVIVFAISSTIGSAVRAGEAAADEQSNAKRYLEFDGRRFYLASETKDDGHLIKEYIPQGETLDHWNELMSIQVYFNIPEGVGIKGFMKGMEESIKAKNPDNRCVSTYDEKTGQGVLDFLMWNDKPVHYGEWNLMFLNTNQNGFIVLFQYARRRYVSQQDAAGTKVGEEIAGWRKTVTGLINGDTIVEKEERPAEIPQKNLSDSMKERLD